MQKLYFEKITNKDPTARTVVLIHGVISDHSFFDGMVHGLSQYFTVISYDRRGYGISNYEKPYDFSVKAQVEDLHELIISNAKSPVTIIAHSAGCVIAAEFSILYPELVEKMILVEPSFGYLEEDYLNLKLWNGQLNSFSASANNAKGLKSFQEMIGDGSSEPEKKVDMKELKKSVMNLKNFLQGELNEIQLFRPNREQFENLSFPIFIGVTDIGRNTIWGKTSIHDAEILSFPMIELPGNHNSIKEKPNEVLDVFVHYL